METAILIADQLNGTPVSVRDAREVNDETGLGRVVQLVSQVARPADAAQPARVDYTSVADSVEDLDGQRPTVEGDAGGYLSSFQVWGSGVRRENIPNGHLWWGVVYDGTNTIVKIYASNPSGGGVSPVSQGTKSGRGGWVNLSEVNGSGISAIVSVAGTVVTDDEDVANTLTFQDWFLDCVPLGDCGGRIGICLMVNNFSAFTYADITPLVLGDGSLIARLETKRFERGAADFTTPYDILLLPVQWWDVQGLNTIAVHVTAIGGGGGVFPQIIKG
jgi:hypothetical protein